MDAPKDPVAELSLSKRGRPRPPWLVRTAGAWSQLLLSLALLRTLAAVAGVVPPTVLAMSWWGPGNLAVVGAGLAAIGLVTSLLVWRRVGWLRRFWLLVLFGLHAITLVVFPTAWLLDWFQTDEVLFRAETDRGEFALTIDDGIDPAATPLILATLARHDARATFFVLGQSVLDHPELAKRCLDEGHELANHQMADTPAIALQAKDLEEQIREADQALLAITQPDWFRPGGGFMTDRAATVCQGLGYRVALGSVFPFDPYQSSARFSAAYIAGRAGPGQIVVLHDGRGRGVRTAQALEKAMPQLAERGLRAVTLSELVAE